MAKKNTQLRNRRLVLIERWRQQGHLCIWCGGWTWMQGVIGERDARIIIALADPGSEVRAAALLSRKATREHIMPKSRGGKHDRSNIVCACAGCNGRRGNDPVKFQPELQVMNGLPTDVQQRLIDVCGPHY